MEKSVSNKEKHVWNKTHVWKKVSLIRKNMFGIKHMCGKSVSNNKKHVWNKSIFQNVSNKEHVSCIWYRRVPQILICKKNWEDSSTH